MDKFGLFGTYHCTYLGARTFLSLIKETGKNTRSPGWYFHFPDKVRILITTNYGPITDTLRRTRVWIKSVVVPCGYVVLNVFINTFQFCLTANNMSWETRLPTKFYIVLVCKFGNGWLTKLPITYDIRPRLFEILCIFSNFIFPSRWL